MSIFVLDDSEERMEIFRERLGNIIEAKNYSQAIYWLKCSGPFDVVYLDHDLGEDRSGLDVARHIANMPSDKQH